MFQEIEFCARLVKIWVTARRSVVDGLIACAFALPAGSLWEVKAENWWRADPSFSLHHHQTPNQVKSSEREEACFRASRQAISTPFRFNYRFKTLFRLGRFARRIAVNAF